MHSKFTDIQKADVIAQYWRGKPVTKICEEFAVSKSTVYAWIRPCSVKKEAAAVGRHVFIQKEMVNLQNKMCRLNTIIEILGKADKHRKKENSRNWVFHNSDYFSNGCGGRIRTNDLRVMSPTSYQLLYPAIFSADLSALL